MSRSRGRDGLMKFTGPNALVILDGCGIREEQAYNCVALAKTPFLDELRETKCSVPGCERKSKYFEQTSYTELVAVGPKVGMPEGAKGSTAVGHEVLSGVDYIHPMHQINAAVTEGVMVNPVIDEAIDYAVTRDSSIHLMGLVS
ncbi:MAG: hypothetical protein V1794_11370, partial [Candidatus Glassbacteria bacterium]